MKVHIRSPTVKEVRKSEQCRHTFRITVAKCAPCDGYNLNCEHYEKTNKGAADSKGASIVQESVAKAVEEFQEWQRSIGRDINPMELIARLRAAGVKRVELRQPVDKVIENGMDSGKAVVQIPKLSGTPTIIYGGIEDD